MSENNHQNITATENATTEKKEPETTAQPAVEKKEPMTAQMAAKLATKGKMKLLTPIRANNKDHTELNFDFGALSGWDFVNAMDSDDTGKANAFRITERQALSLFAAAAAKATDDIDAEDIKRRMGIEDCIKATQLATLFFNGSSRAGNLRISN